jgi:hypothetical protein
MAKSKKIIMNIDKIEKGEIVYCNITVEYINNKLKSKFPIKKRLNNIIFSRFYDCINFPNLDVIKYSMFINKLDKKNAQYIDNIKIVDLSILARTGYKHKYN